MALKDIEYLLKLEKYIIKCYILIYTIKVHQKAIFILQKWFIQLLAIQDMYDLFALEKLISQNKLLWLKFYYHTKVNVWALSQ